MIWNDHSQYVEKYVRWTTYEKDDVFQTNHFPRGIDSRRRLIYKSQIFSSSPHGEGCFLCTVITAAPSFLRSEVKPPRIPSFPPLALFWLAAESTEWQPGRDGAQPAAGVLSCNKGSHTSWGIHTDGLCCSCADHTLPLSPATCGSPLA